MRKKVVSVMGAAALAATFGVFTSAAPASAVCRASTPTVASTDMYSPDCAGGRHGPPGGICPPVYCRG